MKILLMALVVAGLVGPVMPIQSSTAPSTDEICMGNTGCESEISGIQNYEDGDYPY